jgi:hypothetical protein
MPTLETARVGMRIACVWASVGPVGPQAHTMPTMDNLKKPQDYGDIMDRAKSTRL